MRTTTFALFAACCALALLVPTLHVAGAPVSAETATQAVNGWLQRDRVHFGEPLGSQAQSVETFKDASGRVLFYAVYLRPTGFVIMAGDDWVEPVLAFGGRGRFDSSSKNPLGALVGRDVPARLARVRARGANPPTPDFLKANNKWKTLLAAVSASSTANSLSAAPVTGVSDLRIAPFVQTLWNQFTANNYFDGPACYNYYTPPNSAGSADNDVCGCVATAMAQLMRYYQYPTAGVGTATFTDQVYSVATKLTLRGGNGAGGPYAWTNMPVNPTNATTAQCQAIGALTFDCAVAAGMNFTETGSSAYDSAAKAALLGVFKYSNAVHGVGPDGTLLGGTNLLAMINPNLDARRPVMLGIDGASGGHEVVCDGYGYISGTIYHHLNMGWGGVDNVWYALPDIDAPATGDTFSLITACTYNICTNGSGEIISGRIVSTAGSPLPGMTLTASSTNGGPYSATTDTNGIYVFENVPSQTRFTITITTGLSKLNAVIYASTGLSADTSPATGNVWEGDFTFLPAPVLSWRTPAQIGYGTPLTGAQLNAIASVGGTFVYSPPLGTVLPAGEGQTLVATFNPADTTHYSTIKAFVEINVLPAPLTVSGLEASNQVYDGTNTAALTGAPVLAGVVTGHPATLGGKATGTFADKNVGVGKKVTVGGLSLTGTNAANYTLTLPVLTANITPADLSVNGLKASSKVYDGRTSALVNGSPALAGVIGHDVVSLAGTAAGTFADQNVGVGKAVMVSGLSLSGSGAGNYALTPPVLTATITPATLTVTGLVAANKVYNGTIAALVNGAPALVGVIGQDAVSVTGTASGTFTNKNVGIVKAVTVSGLSLSGASAANYALTLPLLTANITPAGLTVSGITAANKIYNGWTGAVVNGIPVLVGVIGQDAVSLAGAASGLFADKNIGIAKTVTVSGLSLAGSSAADYALTLPALTANITQASLTVSGITAANKVYDGTTTAMINTANATLVGVPPIDVGNVALVTTAASGAFTDPGIGTNKTVVITGLGLSGVVAGNYTLTQPTASASITSAALTILNPAMTGATFNLSVATSEGMSYVLEYKNSFGDSGWQQVGTQTGTGGIVTFSDTNATGTARFYRVLVQ